MNPPKQPAAVPDERSGSRVLMGFFMAGLGAVLFAGKAVVAKMTYRYGIDAATLIAFRMLFALPLFMAVGWWQARKARRGELERLTWRDGLRVAALGLIGYYASSMLDFMGLRYVTAGLERLILFLSPTMVVLLSAWWFKRAVTRSQWWSMGLCYIGVVLVFAHDLRQQSDGGIVLLGSLYVFGSALSYALYLIFAGQLVKRVGSTRLTAYAMMVSAVACIVQYFFIHDAGLLFTQPAGVYGYSLVHATLNTVAPVFLLMWAVAAIGAPTAALVGMVGPVSVLFLAWRLLGEPITLWQLAGTVLVLGGVFVLSRGKN